MHRYNGIRKLLSFLLLVLVFGSCGESNTGPINHKTATGQSCVTCHIDQEALIALAVEESESTGEAGEG